MDRFALVDEVAKFKAAGTGRLRDLLREEEILARLTQQAKGSHLDAFFIDRLFREIMDHSLRRQQDFIAEQDNTGPTTDQVRIVAYQGTDGAYSQSAARKHFSTRGAETLFKGFDTFEGAMEAVANGGVDYAVLPIENTTAGSINDVYDLLWHSDVAIVGEEVWRVHHCLIAIEDAPLNRIHRVYSHPQALAQCSQFLASRTDWRVESFTDTAMAARKIRDEQDLSQAAIASEDAATLYNLKVIRRDIANQSENYTRFVVVAAEPARYDLRVSCKTSLMFTTGHEKGALLACLNSLADHDLSLTKLESRPRPNTPWQYLFYVDFEGNVADKNVEQAIRELTGNTSFLKVLGSYPARCAGEAEPPTSFSTTARPPTSGKTTPSKSILEMLEKKPYKLASRATRADDTLIKVGQVVIGGHKPVVIAGPCSVESREQLMACAERVKSLGADILRGGCFKPRTSPYSFQGLGYEGLELLIEAGRKYQLPVVTEVLHPSDVEKVARSADILQIGARNMQNFALLKEVGQVDRPVMLKRGMMASIDEWLSAAEYILSHGNQQVFLCERGIRTFETATRSTLDLSAVPVARERTHLPIIVDPSHACGVWQWIPKMTEAALAAGAHGVMIEIHPDPAVALCDGPQALTFDTFEHLMNSISRR